MLTASDSFRSVSYISLMLLAVAQLRLSETSKIALWALWAQEKYDQYQRELTAAVSEASDHQRPKTWVETVTLEVGHNPRAPNPSHKIWCRCILNIYIHVQLHTHIHLHSHISYILNSFPLSLSLKYIYIHMSNRQNYCNTNLVLLRLGHSEGAQNLHNR